MEPTRAFLEAVDVWERAAQDLLEVARQVVPLTEQEFIAELQQDAPVPESLESGATAVTDAADRVFAELQGPLAEDDDDAFRRMFAFLVGNMSVADAIMTAADSPDAIVASLRLQSIDAFPAAAWQRDIAEAAAALRGFDLVRGAQDDDLGDLNDTLKKLTDQSGDELLAIGRDTVLAVALPHLGVALNSVLTGQAAQAFDVIRAGINAAWMAVKKAGAKVMTWAISHVAAVLPNSMHQRITDAVTKIRDSLLDHAGHGVGRIAAEILGLEETRKAWRQASIQERTAALPRLTGVTDDEMSLIRKVTKVRTFIDKYGRWLISLFVRIPQVILAVAALAAAAMVLVLSALWHGLREIEGLVNV